jgi:hypothetical protein
MTRFYSALDEACDRRASALKRDLTSDEVQELEDSLLIVGLRLERFDDLIAHALEEFELCDGKAFCASLGHPLARTKDRARFEHLFRGLTDSREAAFWQSWPHAQKGNIGAMKESAMHLAQALHALADLYTCYGQLKGEAGKEAVKSEMLRLQARTPLPKARAESPSEA